MTKTNRSWDLLSEDQRKTAVEAVINFYATQRDEKIGIIAAEEILDMFLQTVGVSLYDKGVGDASKFVKEHLENMVIDMEVSLKKSD